MQLRTPWYVLSERFETIPERIANVLSPLCVARGALPMASHIAFAFFHPKPRHLPKPHPKALIRRYWRMALSKDRGSIIAALGVNQCNSHRFASHIGSDDTKGPAIGGNRIFVATDPAPRLSNRDPVGAIGAIEGSVWPACFDDCCHLQRCGKKAPGDGLLAPFRGVAPLVNARTCSSLCSQIATQHLR